MNCIQWRLNGVNLIVKEIKKMIMDKRAKHKALSVCIYLPSILLVAGGTQA